MSTVAIIENELQDFNSVKGIFEENNVWPSDYSKFWRKIDTSNENELILNIFKILKDKILNNTISVIIMDISLCGDNDDAGIKIIEKIRNEADLQCKLIPVFCYSRHGRSSERRKLALKNGATAVFNKEDINNTGVIAQQNIKEFQIHLKTQMFAYAMAHYELSVLQRIDKKLLSIQDSHTDFSKKLSVVAEMLLTMIKLDDLDRISNDEEKEMLIKNIVGGEDQLEQIRKKMYQIEDKYSQVEILNDISDVLSSIPGLNFILPIVPKLFSIIRKNAD